jgi:hypothetical protein
MALNPMILAVSALAAENSGLSSKQAIPLALVGSMMKPPMMGLVLALALARSEERTRSAPYVVPSRPVPVTLNAIASSCSQINHSWTGPRGTATYTVRRGTTQNAEKKIIAEALTSTNYSDTGLDRDQNVMYYYVVEAFDSTGKLVGTSTEVPVELPTSPL